MKLIDEDNAVIYVCGDADNMAKDVNQAFIDVFSEHKGKTSQLSTIYIKLSSCISSTCKVISYSDRMLLN